MKEQLQIAQAELADLGDSLQRMTAEKEDASARAATAEKQNSQLEKDLRSMTSTLDVSVCVMCMCVFGHV